MAFAELRESVARLADQGLSSLALYERLEALLVSGGDARLTLSRPARRNAYGCTPFPDPLLLDFASSTASLISEAAYARVERARTGLLARAAAVGLEQAFEHSVEDARSALRGYFGIGDAEIVFSPSGTDAQLQALFLVKALLGAPLVSIIAGADQTGRGTAHTARGHHFSSCTAQGMQVDEGAALAGLGENLRTVEIPFCDAQGHLRDEAGMDAAVAGAVETAIAGGAKVLLQALDSSKLGWRAPSAACVAALARRWPDDLRVVIDACQMRLGAERLRRYLDQGFLVLATGSKYFTGPPFSGALLVPPMLASAIDAVQSAPAGLCDYSNVFDWPRRWPKLRAAFPKSPNYGQWLRWEAALEEMRAYFAVPQSFREAVLGECAAQIPQLISASGNLALLDARQDDDALDGEMRHRSIFAFVPHRDGRALTLEECGPLYRAMSRDLSRHAAIQDRAVAARLCQIGQPVALHHRPGAALRLCVSARLVTNCFTADAIEVELVNAAAIIEKIEWLIAHPDAAA